MKPFSVLFVNKAPWVPDKGDMDVEKKTSTLFAAMQIYYKSSPEIPVPPVRFYDNNEQAMRNMKECAEKEAALTR